MSWPPGVGELLPRVDEAWYADEKWADWILAERGHAGEWARVFSVKLADRERIWHAITTVSFSAKIDTAREAPDGITCWVIAEITLGDRTARVRIVWHYAHEGAAPRLVTAYRPSRLTGMARVREIAIGDLVELTEPIDRAPAGATGGITDVLENGKVIVELTSLPPGPELDRIVIVSPDKLRFM